MSELQPFPVFHYADANDSKDPCWFRVVRRTCTDVSFLYADAVLVDFLTNADVAAQLASQMNLGGCK